MLVRYQTFFFDRNGVVCAVAVFQKLGKWTCPNRIKAMGSL
jgi:hypothetical protein